MKLQIKKEDRSFLEKKTMNLCDQPRWNGNDPRMITPLAVILLLVLALFTKVFVLDKMAVIAQNRASISALEDETAEYLAKIDQMREMEEEYLSYTDAVYTTEELNQVDLQELLAEIDSRILNRSDALSFSLENNILNLELTKVTLAQAADIMAVLYESPYVENVTVSTAATEEEGGNATNVTANMTVFLKNPDGVPASGKEVAAE